MGTVGGNYVGLCQGKCGGVSLAIRIIPVLLRRGDSLVKGRKFDAWRIVGHPLQAARIYAARGVDELMILDLDAERPDLKIIERLTYDAFTPITVGGGIRVMSDIQDLLNAGADKICIKSTQIVQEASSRFGQQAICASLEVRNGMDAIRQAKELEQMGAGEILLQSVDRDGVMEGYDLDLIREVSEAVNIPVIASGGCGTPQHALEAIRAGASAVAIGAMFSFTDYTPRNTATYLSEHGVTVRLH